MPALTVPMGAKAPYAFRVLLSNASGDLDPINFTTVTACQLEVRNQTGTLVGYWTTTLSAQASTTLTATHVFDADGAEVATAGALSIRPILTLPDGERFCASFTLQPTR